MGGLDAVSLLALPLWNLLRRSGLSTLTLCTRRVRTSWEGCSSQVSTCTASGMRVQDTAAPGAGEGGDSVYMRNLPQSWLPSTGKHILRHLSRPSEQRVLRAFSMLLLPAAFHHHHWPYCCFILVISILLSLLILWSKKNKNCPIL